MDQKQTIEALSSHYQVSASTIKRRLREISRERVLPPLCGSGYVHLDVTYWGRSCGVLLALDNETGIPLYWNFVGSEKNQDYIDAVVSIEQRGYQIRGIIIDGKEGLFKAFSDYHIQMCQFHMKQIIRRYLTQRPKLLAARALLDLINRLHTMRGDEFASEYGVWKNTWHEVLFRRSVLQSGRTQFTHKRLRTAMNSLDRHLPFLFTYQSEECKGMPNTNNKIEGTFTDLKKNLNNHSGMSFTNRERFVNGFFLALAELHTAKRR